MKLELSIKDWKIQVSDGYHTFDELYEHRQVLFIALCNELSKHQNLSRKSKLHADWTMYDWMFIMGIYGIGTYHIDNNYWDKCKVVTLNKAPERDWHTSDDVLNRLLEI